MNDIDKLKFIESVLNQLKIKGNKEYWIQRILNTKTISAKYDLASSIDLNK